MKMFNGLLSGVALVASLVVGADVHAAQSCPSARPTADIVDTAVAAGQFQTLVAAVQAANLVSTLKSAGPFTVFAPNDDAFAKLPAGTVQGLLNDIPALTTILTYHVAAGEIAPSQLRGSKMTVEGRSVNFSRRGNDLYVNDSKILAGPIATSNGVIYVIDSVLLP
jgi:uncharacterized surface protein with fasciclin (FAS1) repeats